MSGDLYSAILQNTLNLNFCLLCCGVFSFFILSVFEKYLWLNIQDKFCKKYNGVCDDCSCWSCTKRDLDHKRGISNEKV